jgi:RNA polymerase sigma-70 factor, ECF subfamily
MPHLMGKRTYSGRGEPRRVQEPQLIDQVLRGDPAAQRAFYDAHVGRIFRLAYRMTGDDASARDCTQLAFIQLFAKLRSFRGEAALSTWVHAVAVSVILQWRRKTKHHRQREVEIEEAHDVAVGCSAFEQVLDETVRRAIDGLASRYRIVVVMHDIEGYTHDEIGAALGIKVATSKIRLSRARKKLRAALADYSGDLAYEQ